MVYFYSVRAPFLPNHFNHRERVSNRTRQTNKIRREKKAPPTPPAIFYFTELYKMLLAGDEWEMILGFRHSSDLDIYLHRRRRRIGGGGVCVPPKHLVKYSILPTTACLLACLLVMHACVWKHYSHCFWMRSTIIASIFPESKTFNWFE